MVKCSVDVFAHQGETQRRKFTLESGLVLPVCRGVNLEKPINVTLQHWIQQGCVDVHINAVLGLLLHILYATRCELDATVTEAYARCNLPRDATPRTVVFVDVLAHQLRLHADRPLLHLHGDELKLPHDSIVGRFLVETGSIFDRLDARANTPGLDGHLNENGIDVM